MLTIEKIPETYPSAKINELKPLATAAQMKYFNHEYFIPIAVYENKVLKLHTLTDKSVLDISAGFCLFAWIAQQLGHNVTVTDIPEEKLYSEVRTILGMNYVPHTYDTVKYDRLQFADNSFDVVKAKSVVPMCSWTIETWKEFILDCHRILKPGGTLWVYPNNTGTKNLALCVKTFESELFSDKFKLVELRNHAIMLKR